MYIHDYADADYALFHRMFLRYFAEDLDLHYSDETMDEVVNEVLSDLRYHCWLWIARERDVPVGFALAQIDTPDNPWCLRPGQGFIREFAVEPSFRGQGAARGLLSAVEARFRARGVSAVYLTTQNTSFWSHMGYVPDGTVCSRNQMQVFVRSLLYLPPLP